MSQCPLAESRQRASVEQRRTRIPGVEEQVDGLFFLLHVHPSNTVIDRIQLDNQLVGTNDCVTRGIDANAHNAVVIGDCIDVGAPAVATGSLLFAVVYHQVDGGTLALQGTFTC